MKPIYKKYLKTVALVWAGSFVLFVFVYVLAMMPQRSSKKQIEKLLADKKQIYDSARNAAQEETQNRLNEQIRHLRNRLGDFVIDSEDLTNLTFDVSQIASEKGLGSFSISIENSDSAAAVASDDSYLLERNIDISFNAGFNQFAEMLSALERCRPVIFVDKFTITRGSLGDSKHRVSMDLVVFVKKRQDS
jgi:hypothetical protein